jgi:AcrR family transcriptional regulator
MAHRYDHLREKAISLRTQQQLTLEDIVERLKLPKTTVYHWIKDLPIPYTEKQTEAQRRRANLVRAKYADLRDQAYMQGLAEAPELLKEPSFRDFVVLYMAEGFKRNRNKVEFVNSDTRMIVLAHRWIQYLTPKKISYRLQSHIDHDDEALKRHWASLLDVQTVDIKVMRKSNSGKLAGRQFRSEYGVLSLGVNDTYLRMRLQAWMDIVKAQW